MILLVFIMKAYGLSVKGRVHRVSYRRHLLNLTQELGLAGYVENSLDEDPKVSAEYEGDDPL